MGLASGGSATNGASYLTIMTLPGSTAIASCDLICFVKYTCTELNFNELNFAKLHWTAINYTALHCIAHYCTAQFRTGQGATVGCSTSLTIHLYRAGQCSVELCTVLHTTKQKLHIPNLLTKAFWWPIRDFRVTICTKLHKSNWKGGGGPSTRPWVTCPICLTWYWF